MHFGLTKVDVHYYFNVLRHAYVHKYLTCVYLYVIYFYFFSCNINSLRRKLLLGTEEKSSGFQRQESIDEGLVNFILFPFHFFYYLKLKLDENRSYAAIIDEPIPWSPFVRLLVCVWLLTTYCHLQYIDFCCCFTKYLRVLLNSRWILKSKVVVITLAVSSDKCSLCYAGDFVVNSSKLRDSGSNTWSMNVPKNLLECMCLNVVVVVVWICILCLFLGGSLEQMVCPVDSSDLMQDL